MGIIKKILSWFSPKKKEKPFTKDRVDEIQEVIQKASNWFEKQKVQKPAAKIPIGRMPLTKKEVVESIVEKAVIDSALKNKPGVRKPSRVVSRRAKVRAGYFTPRDLRQGNSLKLSMGWITGWKPVQKRSGKHRSQEIKRKAA